MKSRFAPSLIGGLVIGVCSSLPMLSVCNCFCCMWVILGGALAVFLHQRSQVSGGSLTGSIWTGWLAGMWGTLFCTIGNTLQYSLGGSAAMLENYQFQFQQSADLPGYTETMQKVGDLLSGPYGVIVSTLGTLVVCAFFYSFFAPLGGLLAHSLRHTFTPPQPPRPFEPIAPAGPPPGDYQI